jgi:23S rRNA pseudouridine1911/1915/1917 synthase
MNRSFMNKNGHVNIDAGQKGVRLDAFLAGHEPDVSRSQWSTLIRNGWVKVNGLPCKPNHKLRADEIIEWIVPELTPSEVLPEEIPLDILFEDEHVLVLNKQPGLVVHPAAGHETGTLVNALLFHDAAFTSLERAGIVHRLDKDTSGAMVVAKSGEAMAELQRQFKARETEKQYLALVWGDPPPAGRIESPIGRHPVSRQKMAVLKEGGREAISNFETLERFDETALVRVRIETGRTHQIRVHMAHIGHPVVGDAVYGRRRKGKPPSDPPRQMLHAAKLSFSHPHTGKRLSFEPPLPDDMKNALQELRSR